MATGSDEAELGSDIAIFGRLLNARQGKMTPALARHILRLGFGDDEQRRIEELAARNQAGQLSRAEQAQLMGYVKAGHLLALLHAQARAALGPRKVS